MTVQQVDALKREREAQRAAAQRERQRPVLGAKRLRERGWTETLIRRFLGEPDRLGTNPHYRNADPMRFWYAERVEQIEATSEFQAARERSAKRQEAALAGAETARRNRLERQRETRRTEFWRAYGPHVGEFRTQYQEPSSLAALAAAAEALFALNRLAKHRSSPRQAIYTLKNSLITRLWDDGYCDEAAIAQSPAKACWSCGGTGTAFDFDDRDDACHRCGGTSVWRESESYWALRFRIGERCYSWHQPAELAPWATQIGDPQPHDVIAEVKAVDLSPCEVKRARALLHWVLGHLADDGTTDATDRYLSLLYEGQREIAIGT